MTKTMPKPPYRPKNANVITMSPAGVSRTLDFSGNAPNVSTPTIIPVPNHVPRVLQNTQQTSQNQNTEQTTQQGTQQTITLINSDVDSPNHQEDSPSSTNAVFSDSQASNKSVTLNQRPNPKNMTHPTGLDM